MYIELIQQFKNLPTRLITTSKVYADFDMYLRETTDFLPLEASSTQRLWHHWNNEFNIPPCTHCNTTVVGWNVATQTYREFCSRSCSIDYRRSIDKTEEIGPLCINSPCENRVTTKQKNQWALSCSPGCSREYRATLRVSEADMLDFIESNGELCPVYISLNSQYPAMFNTIVSHTQHLPSSYQINERISWLLGNKKTHKETLMLEVKEILKDYDIPEFITSPSAAKGYLSFKKNPKCTQCGIHDRTKRNMSLDTYSKFCSSDCEYKWDKNLQIKKLIHVIKTNKTNTPFVPSNKNLDPRLNSRDWLVDYHHNKQITKGGIAKILEVDKETITNRFKEFDIEGITWVKSRAEEEVFDFISSVTNSDVIRGNRSIIKPRELDMIIPDKKIAIEYCGLYWHSSKHERITPSYHSSKMTGCNSAGYRLLTIFEDEWIHSPEQVKSKLISILSDQPQKRVFARKCTIGIPTKKEKKDFLNAYHIQGNGKGSIDLGLYYLSELVAVMTFFTEKDHYVLNRYATKYNILGGFSKLISHFRKTHTEQIVSFADLRWSSEESNVYVKNGFILDKRLPPDYAYVDLSNTKRIHKFNFRRKFLSQKLKHFDPNESEVANCENNNWFRIYNCGLLRYILN